MNDIATTPLVMEGFERSANKMHDCRYTATKGRCHGNHFLAFYIWGAHSRHLANTTEPSMCGGDAALSNYFDDLLLKVMDMAIMPVCSDSATLVISSSFVAWRRRAGSTLIRSFTSHGPMTACASACIRMNCLV